MTDHPSRIDLTTERLTLAPMTREQTDRAHTLWTNAEMRQFLWHNEIIDRKEAISALKKSEDDFNQRQYGLWGLHLRHHEDLIGFCGLRTNDEDGVPELLFGLLPAYWGLGIVTEAAREVVRYAFEDLHVDSIRGATLVSNAASVRVLEHLGAEFLGREHGADGEMLIYHLTPSRFRTLAQDSEI
jgi:RimJ/RimL family protein N-acetyltransferase